MFDLERFSRISILFTLVVTPCTFAALDLGLGDDSDLTSFVTRPDIKAPILRVTKHHPDRVAAGYFFTAPYVSTYQEKWPKSYYQACQTGPHIYDNDGELVWSGARTFSNRNQADFRPINVDGTWHLSSIDVGLEADGAQKTAAGNRTGHGLIMDASYALQTKLRAPKAIDTFNMHEFRIIDGGKSALTILKKPEYTDVSMLDGVQREAGWVNNMGFAEIDTITGRSNFQWWALQNLDLTESNTLPQHISGPLPKAWDCFHINSVDKTPDGDYLISSKHTDTIFRISQKDGSVKWRIGGKFSDFKTEGFNISRQHDARSLNPKELPFKAEKGTEYISFYNHPRHESSSSASSPSMLIISLDPKRKISRLMLEIHRPVRTSLHSTIPSGAGRGGGGGGNTHFLPNGNLFASWSSNAYVTEHDPSDANRMVMEASFLSDRFETYRTYKSDFRAVPSEPMAVVCNAYGTSEQKATTACWVSWNGATDEVREYRFLAADEEEEEDRRRVLRTVARKGFETRMMVKGFARAVVVEALGEKGDVLGRSERVGVGVVGGGW